MIRVICRQADGNVGVDLPVSELPRLLADKDNRVWVDMQGASNGEYARVLAQVFHFHPLAIEDALSDTHLPKLDDYASYLYLVFHTVALGDEEMDIDTEEVDVFLGINFLVTIHEDERRSINRCWNAEHHAEVGLARGASDAALRTAR
jgi:magnesium transporter